MSTTTRESVADFAARARAWIEASLPPLAEPVEDDVVLQNRIFDAGFGGIAFPQEYGGAGLTLEHQAAFYDLCEELGRQVPGKYWVSIGMVAPLLLERASEPLKRRFLPPILRGDIVVIQLLSEPRGGSDLAGVTTRLTRDGDSYVLNGAKMWSTNAYLADYGACLARSDPERPKHRGLSMILVPLKGTPGVSLSRTRMADGQLGDVCEEFFDDVELPVDNLIGDENDGWSVAQTLLFHERNQTAGVGYGRLGGSRAVMVVDRSGIARELAQQAEREGTLEEHGPAIADLYIDSVVGRLTSNRVMRGGVLGTHQGPWGSVGKLLGSEQSHAAARTALAVRGADGVTWDGEEVELDNAGTDWLTARTSTIGGGTSEIQRNIISERLLGLPREPSVDRDVPFSEVLRNAARF